jgi:phosphopantothenoylcysteine decarboxylase/phosphopantothenate--cysteine ligase
MMAGQRVLITAGPTQEAIDPVRYIGNRSSGKMGYALATALAELGALVTLVSGPTALACPRRVERVDCESAAQMHAGDGACCGLRSVHRHGGGRGLSA